MDRRATAVDLHPLRVAREAAGLSVLGLAYEAGVNMRTIERIEAGTVTPRPATLKVIADVLGCEPAVLVPVPSEAAA